MSRSSLKEDILVPMNIGGVALAVFGVFKAYHGERVPGLMTLLSICVLATSWIVLRTRGLDPKKAGIGASLTFATMSFGLFLLLRGYGMAS